MESSENVLTYSYADVRYVTTIVITWLSKTYRLNCVCIAINKWKYYQNFQYTDFESVEKVARKINAKKIINQKVVEKWSFWLLCRMHISAHNFLCEFYCIFSMGLKTASNIFIIWYPNQIFKTFSLFILTLFANFEANMDESAHKNLFCVLEFYYCNPLPVWLAPLCQKRSKVLFPNVQRFKFYLFSIHKQVGWRALSFI